jgi:glutamate-ammonia-ligase adenylyltransferase
MIAANPQLVGEFAKVDDADDEPQYADLLMTAVTAAAGFRDRLSVLRRTWSRLLLNIVVRDVFGKADMFEAKRLQTLLGEASIATALEIVRVELSRKFAVDIEALHLAVLGLGKLGGHGLDYDSDLDMVLVYDDTLPSPVADLTETEFYARVAEMLVTTLSSMTRDGSLYRVDLRLRPYGSKGLTAMPASGFIEYLENTAAIWEMLAFVKLRAAGGDMDLGNPVEQNARKIIHERALEIDPGELASETRRVRLALQKQRTRPRRGTEVDIKYGEGGMLDVYFAMRYLQLRHNVPDDPKDRSTTAMLAQLAEHPSLTNQRTSLEALRDGYRFLSRLDHNLRLTVGRTTRVPLGKQAVIETIAGRMSFAQPSVLLERLTLNRVAIRVAFEALTD